MKISQEQREEIKKLWLTGEYTQQQLGDRYGVSTKTVSNIANNNFSVRSQGQHIDWSSEEEKEIMRLYSEGWSSYELARKYSVSYVTVITLLKRLGVQIRIGNTIAHRTSLRKKDPYLRARQRSLTALHRGEITKQRCELCVEEDANFDGGRAIDQSQPGWEKGLRVEMHHQDYEKHLEVIFTCRRHHREIDKRYPPKPLPEQKPKIYFTGIPKSTIAKATLCYTGMPKMVGKPNCPKTHVKAPKIDFAGKTHKTSTRKRSRRSDDPNPHQPGLFA